MFGGCDQAEKTIDIKIMKDDIPEDIAALPSQVVGPWHLALQESEDFFVDLTNVRCASKDTKPQLALMLAHIGIGLHSGFLCQEGFAALGPVATARLLKTAVDCMGLQLNG